MVEKLGVETTQEKCSGHADSTLPGLGRGVQAQLLDLVELTDAVVLVVAHQVARALVSFQLPWLFHFSLGFRERNLPTPIPSSEAIGKAINMVTNINGSLDPTPEQAAVNRK